MKIFLTCLIILTIGMKAQAQTDKKELYKIHKLLHQNFLSEGKYTVFGTTKKNVIQNFDFKNPDGIDTSATNVWKKAEWKNFLNSIDTSIVSNYSLATAGKPWFKSAGKPKKIIVFAPVILSGDGNLAISIIKLINRLGRASTSIVYFLQKENGNWKIKQHRTISITDFS